MPRGDTIARIDGPDRRGWVFASATLAYYPVMRREFENTIHRIDLRTGSRARIVTDSRPGMQFLYEWGPEFTALALTTDNRRLLAARVLRSDPRVWIGRYDASSGTLETGRSWPISGSSATVRLSLVGDVFVMVTGAAVDGTIAQTMRVLDEDLGELAFLSDTDLPAGERCASTLRPVEGARWVTVCAALEGRYASVLSFDGSYRIASRVPVQLDARERVIGWTADGGAVGILTDRARHIRVGVDGGVEAHWLGQPDGRGVIRIAREIAAGVVVAQFNVVAEGESVGDIVTIDLGTGQMLARAVRTTDTAMDFVGAGDRLYALLHGVGDLGPRLQRLDRNSLARIGNAATLPRRDDVIVNGLVALVPGR